jgi:hypothetical protein
MPHSAIGDQQMLEWTAAGPGARLEMLVLHDDAAREYAYGPAAGLPYSKLGTFTQALYDEAKKNGWSVISMKNDWNRMPCGQGLLARFAMWPLASSKLAVDRNCVSSNSWNRCFLEDVHRDEWQLVDGLTEFRGPCFVLHWSRFR